jgi:hypothetical protein
VYKICGYDILVKLLILTIDTIVAPVIGTAKLFGIIKKISIKLFSENHCVNHFPPDNYLLTKGAETMVL